MPRKTNPTLQRILFRSRTGTPETAWGEALPTATHFRLKNILIARKTPILGDVIEATPGDDGDFLQFRRIVERGGRRVMILDYPRAEQLAPLTAMLRAQLDVESEGAMAPRPGSRGRVYLAVPNACSSARVLEAARAHTDGVYSIHPEIGDRPPPLPPAPRPVVARLQRAILDDDERAFQSASPEELAAVDERGRPLLFRAILEGRTGIVSRLVALGASVNPGPDGKHAPLLAAAMRERAKETKLLLAAGADPERARDASGDPVLVVAAFREATGVVRELLKVSHPPDTRSLALLEASGVGNLAIVKLLVASGADPTWVSSKGNSAESVARKRRRADVVAYFKGLKEGGERRTEGDASAKARRRPRA